MPAILSTISWIASGLATAISFLVKHPFVLKMMLFTTFVAVIGSFLIYVKSLVTPYIVSNSLLSLVSYFGVLDAISLYITIVVAGFGAKQILAFIRS